MKMKQLMTLGLALCMTASLSLPACAMSQNIGAPGDPEYGKPTSFEPVATADGGAMKNEDINKNAALIPPGFGTPSADTRNTGFYLTPNLAPGGAPATGSGSINGTGAAVITPGSTITFPTYNDEYLSTGGGQSGGGVVSPGSGQTGDGTVSPSGDLSSGGYTEVFDGLYYDGGYIAALKIPSIGLDVKVYEGTGDNSLSKGVGHFSETSIWGGNVAIAGHNRGVNSYFGKLHTLEPGEMITYSTKLGTRTFQVVSVEKVSVNDATGLTASDTDMLTLYTCVRNQSDSRWKVVAVAM